MKLSSVTKSYEKYPRLRPRELAEAGVVFDILGARGPYSGAFESDFAVFTLLLHEPVDDIEIGDVLLTYYEESERGDILRHFKNGGGPIENVRIERTELDNHRSWWRFVDAS